MSARLSPAATLLRNSKLFALPPAIPLPATPPSSDQISQSDSATSLYPQFAAIQSPPSSRGRGDWGFKRALPSKVNTTSNHAVVRLVRGIDTPEHTADFESAADHVLTLQKFQELNESVQMPRDGYSAAVGKRPSVFQATLDNTTNLSHTAPVRARPTGVWPDVARAEMQAAMPGNLATKQSQIDAAKSADTARDPAPLQPSVKASGIAQQVETKRWRYAGPSLAQLTGIEFDTYLAKLGPAQKKVLLERARQDLIRTRLQTARDRGEMEEATATAQQVTEDEIQNHLRALRSEPRRFGPIIADMLDLPEGKIINIMGGPTPFEFGRDTLASASWEESGPPRSHPSLGLSYLQTRNGANNDPVQGPQRRSMPVVARALSRKAKGTESKTTWGIAGFAVPPATGSDGRRDAYTPIPGGTKAAITTKHVSTTVDGGVQIDYEKLDLGAYVIVDEQPLDRREYERQVNAGLIKDARASTRPAPWMSSRNSPIPTQPAPKRQTPEEVNSILDELEELKFGPARRVSK